MRLKSFLIKNLLERLVMIKGRVNYFCFCAIFLDTCSMRSKTMAQAHASTEITATMLLPSNGAL